VLLQGVHILGEDREPPAQQNPCSTVQFELQPSPLKLLPSSQSSFGSLILSPQIGMHVDECTSNEVP